MIQRVEHRHLLLLQIITDGEALFRNLDEQVAPREPRLALVGQCIAEPSGGLLIVSLDTGREFQRLGQYVVQRVGKVGGTALDALQEVRTAQPVDGHLLDLLLPLLGHVNDPCAEVQQGLVVQLFERGLAVVEKL